MEKLTERLTKLANSKPKSWYTKERLLEALKGLGLFQLKEPNKNDKNCSKRL